MGNKITRRRPVIDERYTRPQGLYPCRDVDQRKLRRLILESKLAPCYPGAEEADKDLEECPICFMQYPSLNRSKCCAKGICTECFLQMKAPHAARPTQCPFCKTPCYAVEYRGARTVEEKGMEQAEEQKVIEAKIRMRQQELQDDEEREQRRVEDTRAGRISNNNQNINNHLTAAIAPSEDELLEGVNWRSGWDSAADHRPQSLALDERNTAGLDPYSLWVDGDYQRAGGVDITVASVQQPAEPISLATVPSVINQQQAEIDFSTAGFVRGEAHAPHREDELDLALEDIMVMEAIWLSIQEQGARHRSSTAEEPNQPAAQNRLSEAESLTAIRLDSGSEDHPADPSPHPVPLHPRGSLAAAIARVFAAQPPASQPSLDTAPRELELEAEQALETAIAAAAVGGEPERRWQSQSVEGSDEIVVASASGETSCSSRNESSKVLLSESFEEQMVLAMALSIADAQTRVHQGDSRSGPLAHMGH